MRVKKIVQGGLRKLHMVVPSTTQIIVKDPRSAPAYLMACGHK